VSDTGELTYTRVHRASPELLFDCLTKPEHLTHFWGPTGTTTPIESIVVDLRPGGRFETTMVGGDGGSYTMRATYTEVRRPERLEWVERAFEAPSGGDADVSLGGGMRTTITFVDLRDGRTEVTTRQVNVPAPLMAPEARAGFATSLDRLDAYLEDVSTAVRSDQGARP